MSDRNKNEWIYSDKVCGKDGNSGINVLSYLEYNELHTIVVIPLKGNIMMILGGHMKLFLMKIKQ